MQDLTPKELIDLALLLLGRNGGQRVVDAAARIQALGTPSFAPCADLVTARLDHCAESGLIALSAAGAPRIHQRYVITPAGIEHAVALGQRLGRRPCDGSRLVFALKLGLSELLPTAERRALLEPVLHRLAQDAREVARHLDGRTGAPLPPWQGGQIHLAQHGIAAHAAE